MISEKRLRSPRASEIAKGHQDTTNCVLISQLVASSSDLSTWRPEVRVSADHFWPMTRMSKKQAADDSGEDQHEQLVRPVGIKELLTAVYVLCISG